LLQESTLLLGVLFVIMATVKAQQPPDNTPEGVVRIVEMKEAHLGFKREGFDAMIFSGDVIFYHDGGLHVLR